jgi:hypothetical protein
MFFEAELDRVVGRSSTSLAILEQLARAPMRPSELQAALRVSSAVAVNYLARLAWRLRPVGDSSRGDARGAGEALGPAPALRRGGEPRPASPGPIPRGESYKPSATSRMLTPP